MDAAPVIQVLRSLRSRAGGLPCAPSDGGLLTRFAQFGDAAAFAELVRRHGPMVLGVCRRRLRDSHDADDAFQATFLVLVRKAAGLRDPESLGPWLYGVAYRTALRCRARSAQRRARERPLSEVPASDAADTDLGPALDEAIHWLPAKYRVPFVLCHLEGLTQTQAARRLGCPPTTIATRLMRARQRLRARLADQGVAPTAVALPLTLAAVTARAAADLRAGRALPVGVAILMKGAGMTILGRTRAVLLAVAVFAVGGGTGLVAMRAPAAAQTVTATPAAEEPPVPPKEPATLPTFRTTNFIVTGGASIAVNRKIAEAAEQARKELALAWLGKELPPWPEPCPVQVEIIPGGPAGYTTLKFDAGKVRSQRIHLNTIWQRLETRALPREITHTIFAHHFGRRIPHWADEGAAILAEDGEELQRHDALVRDLLNQGRGIRLPALFKLADFPQDMMALYAEGYSVTRFLVERGGRPRFVAFLKDGMAGDWDKAVQAHYDFKDVEALEQGWLASLKRDRSSTVLRGARPELSIHWTSALVAGRAVKEQGGDAIIVTIFEPKLNYEPHAVKGPDGKDVTEFWLNSGVTRQTVRLTEVQGHTASGARLSPAQLAERLRQEIPVFLEPDGELINSSYRQLLKPDTIILSIGLPPLAQPAR